MAKETILVPVDFEKASLDALALARDLGARLGAEVVLLHVFTVPVVVYPGFDPIFAPGLPDDIASTARAAVQQLAQTSGGLRAIVREGDPSSVILRVIEEERPKFVVMGTHGRRGLSHFFLGSVAEHVIRGSAVPVLVTKCEEKEKGKA
jgi:nucleotide-binding universal stress UspA family protein